MKDKDPYFVYILQCSDGTLYTGIAKDLNGRVQTHQASEGAKYTRARLPVKLIYSEQFESKSNALKREYEIKQMKRDEKLRLVKP